MLLESLVKFKFGFAMSVLKSLDIQNEKQNKEKGVFFKIDLKKSSSEKGLLYGTFSKANVVDYDGEFISNEELEKMAHKFSENTWVKNNVSIMGGKKGYTHKKKINAYVVESYVDKSTDNWAWKGAVKVDDPEVRNEIKKGNVLGFSVGGWSTRTTVA